MSLNVRITSWFAIVSLLLPLELLGQASFRLQNLDTAYGVNAPVFDALGTPLAGSNYLAELWGAATPDALAPAFNLDHNKDRLMVPFSSGGYFFSTASFLSVPALPTGGGGWAWLEVRAWDARLGPTYEAVAALGLGGYGESPLFYAQGGNPLAEPPTSPGPLIGLQPFSLRPVVPEPSTWALLALGGPVLWWCARQRSKREP